MSSESEKVTINDQLKLRTHFRLVPKSMTLDDLERPFRSLFQNTCIFRAHHENLNEDRPILSGGKDLAQ